MSSAEVIYGVNPVIEVLRAGKRKCHEVYFVNGRRGEDVRLVTDLASRSGVVVNTITKSQMLILARTEKNQGIAARCDPYPFVSLDEVVDTALKDVRKGLILILDCISDPQNLGSLIRTSNLMGVHGVIIPKDKSAPVSPAVVKASAGATEYQRISEVVNIARTIAYIKDMDFWIVGAEGKGQKSTYHYDFTGHNVAIVLGEEGAGMRRLVRESCDCLLSIPMEGSIGSYNVSVAGALFLGEVVRQRSKKLDKSQLVT